MRALARAIAAAFALVVLVAMTVQAAGCSRRGHTAPRRATAPIAVTPALHSGAAPTPPPFDDDVETAFDDDLEGAFFGGTKSASIRIRPWITAPIGSVLRPPSFAHEDPEAAAP